MHDQMTQQSIECAAITTRFYHHLDRRENEQLVALLDADCIWTRLGQDLVGPNAILATLASRPETYLTRHLVSNIVIEHRAPARADAFFELSVYAREGEHPARHIAIMTGQDRLRHDGEHWKIDRKKVLPLFTL